MRPKKRKRTIPAKLAADIIAQAPISIWASRGSEGNFELLSWNQGATEIYGYEADEALGKNYLDLFVSEAEKEASARDCDDVIRGKVFKNFLAEDVAKGNRKRVMLTNCFRARDSRTNEFVQVEVAVDISESLLVQEHEKFRELREVGLQRAADRRRLELEEKAFQLHIDADVSAKRLRDALAICKQALDLADGAPGNGHKKEIERLRERLSKLETK